jgi:hypothetical protein
LERDGIYDRRGGHNQIVEYITPAEFSNNYNEDQGGFPEVSITVEFYDENGKIDLEDDLAPRERGEVTIEDLGEKTILEALLNETAPLPVSKIASINP